MTKYFIEKMCFYVLFSFLSQVITYDLALC